MEDVEGAVGVLSRAVEQLVAAHGELGDEVAEAYFLYGRALTDLGRLKQGVRLLMR
jgi:hypothetical protein